MSDESVVFMGHEPCPECGSRDNLGRWSDGHGYCFGCHHYEDGDGKPSKPPKRKSDEFVPSAPIERVVRGIKPATTRHWRYEIGHLKGKPVHVANYYKEGKLVAQKIRGKGKTFKVIGKLPPLYGMWLWGSGRKLVVTEGELDALSVSQAQGNKWPVVSVPNGAAGAAKALSKASEWLEGFDEIILMFDSDEAGQAAATECAKVLPLGRVKIAKLPLNDPNEMLRAGRVDDLIRAIFNAEPYRPDGVVSLRDVVQSALEPPQWGIEWPYPTLTKLTYGIRLTEWYCFGAGVGVGKSDNFMEIAAHILRQGEKVGLIYLEQPVTETAKRLAGKLDDQLYHVPDVQYDADQLKSTLESVQDRVYHYDHYGASDWQSIKTLIRYLKYGCGVNYVFLDHLTALAAHAEDERRELDSICADISSLCQNLGIAMFVISHLTTPKGEAHEEGGRIKEKHFTGSRAIARWAHYMIGQERDKQAENERLRNLTTLRILKDRYTGKATGETVPISYDHETGRLQEDWDALPTSDESEEAVDYF